jgi:small subunit ribosomal protein S16
MLKIRLARAGAKKRPFYHIVVADVRAPRDGKYKERIGFYNPMVKSEEGERLRLNSERARYWLDKGALPSDRVHRFLAGEGLMASREIPEQTKKHKPHQKTLDLQKAREEKLASKAESETEAEVSEVSDGAGAEESSET